MKITFSSHPADGIIMRNTAVVDEIDNNMYGIVWTTKYPKYLKFRDMKIAVRPAGVLFLFVNICACD